MPQLANIARNAFRPIRMGGVLEQIEMGNYMMDRLSHRVELIHIRWR